MVAANQLILSGQVVVDVNRVITGTSYDSVNGYFVPGSSSAINKDQISSNKIVAHNEIVTNNITTNVTLTSGGTLSVAGAATVGSLNAGTTIFSNTVTLGSVTISNGQVRVSNSYVNNDSLTSPYANLTNLNVVTTLSTNNITANYAAVNGNIIQTAGAHVFRNGTSILFRNTADTQNVAQLSQANGLFFCNLYNNDGSFKATMFRVSVGEGTTDPTLNFGMNTTINGAVVLGNTVAANGLVTANAGLTVNGSFNLNGTAYFTGGLDANNLNMRNDSRVISGANVGAGSMYFGNGDKRVTWDGGNWIIRGGSLYASNLVSDGNVSVGGNLYLAGSADISSNVAIRNDLDVTTNVRVGGEIKSNSGQIRSRGTDGNAAAGRYFFGDGDANITCDGARFYINRSIEMPTRDIVASNGLFLGNLRVRNTNAANARICSVYFGPSDDVNITYDGGQQLNISHNLYVAREANIAGNLNTNSDANSNRIFSNYIESRGTLQGANITSTGSIYSAGTTTSNGDVVARYVVKGAYVQSTGDMSAAGNISSDNLIVGKNGARFQGGEVWVDAGGNYSKLVFGRGRSSLIWDGGSFAFDGQIYTNRQIFAENEITAFGRLRAGRFGGGNFSVDVFGDGNGGGRINTANGELKVQNLFVDSLRANGGTLPISTNGGDIRTGGGTYFGYRVYMDDYVRAGGQVFASTFGPDNLASVALTGDGTGNGIITAGNSNLYVPNVFSFGYYNRSDERLKNISAFMTSNEALTKVLQFKPIRYTWKDGIDDYEHYGFSAQQIESVDDMLVLERNDEARTKHVSVLEMVPLLVASIQELKREIEELKAKA